MEISRISIVGGGVGGLTAALALQHFGYQVSVFEQANELQGVTKRGANPGANADDRGLYLYNPVTVPLTS